MIVSKMATQGSITRPSQRFANVQTRNSHTHTMENPKRKRTLGQLQENQISEYCPNNKVSRGWPHID